jgi:hypothetical protein
MIAIRVGKNIVAFRSAKGWRNRPANRKVRVGGTEGSFRGAKGDDVLGMIAYPIFIFPIIHGCSAAGIRTEPSSC